jgi:nitroimidazol reductase NimA-like FMN-containing flavoprotein (pyridoxamine 5'-phosphate oxidase superfamily)
MQRQNVTSFIRRSRVLCLSLNRATQAPRRSPLSFDRGI